MLHTGPSKAITTILACLSMLAGKAFAQAPDAFPSRPITVIVPATPGGASEVWARLYGQRIAANSPGWQLLIDYKPGAGGTLGTGFVAKAPPDGYTLITVSSTLTTAPLLYKTLPFDPIKSFAPVTLMSNAPGMLMVHPGFPARTFKEYVAYARANPGKINFGTAGVGGTAHLNGIWLHHLMGVEVTYVPYKGAGDLTTAIQGGQIQATFGAMTVNLPVVKAGTARVLGVTTERRAATIPDVPTLAEQGATGFIYDAWTGVAAPAGTPPAIVNRISAEFLKAGKHPDITSKLAASGQESGGSTPEEFARLITRETLHWRKLAAETNLKLEE
jgi:tripartite-type tricarboxylate transporter receptor subunit TctC